MEEKKKNDAIKNVVIVILVVCVLVLGGLLLYKEVFAKKETNNTITNTYTTNKVVNNTVNTNRINNNKEIKSEIQVETKDKIIGNIEVTKYHNTDFRLDDRVVVKYNEVMLTNYVTIPDIAKVEAYQIDNVIILSMSLDDQCGSKYVLVFNTDGTLLNDLTQYQVTELIIDRTAKIVKVNLFVSGECWCCACDGPDCEINNYVTLKVSGKSITVS